jgi:8-oxo-dGTP pyrophosphatase MutT (NUDIX family)
MARLSRSTRAAAALMLCSLVFVRLWHTSDENHPDVAIYSYEGRKDWTDFNGMHNLDRLDDSRIVSRGTTVPISTVHAEGLFHRGLWLAVARRRDGGGDEILLLHRSMSMKTCPGAWGLVGEHSNPEEPWRTTGARALREELGLGVADDDAGLVNLAPGTSYLVKVAYDDVKRRDLQATALFFYRISSDAPLHFDEEVAGARWVAPRELKRLEFCNGEITALAGVVAELSHHRGGRGVL